MNRFAFISVRRLLSFLAGVVGLVLVAGSGYGVYLLAVYASQPKPEETIEVVVVAAEIADRTPIARAALRLEEYPARVVPAGVATRIEEVEGKMSAGKLVPGEMLLRHRLLAGRDAFATLALQLEPEEVAITFPAAGIAAVDGLTPGDRVDLMVTVTGYAGPDGAIARLPVTLTPLQNLRVLAVSKGGAVIRKPGLLAEPANPYSVTNAAVVVFAATRQDAEHLKALKDADNVVLDLVLRPVGSNDIVPSKGVTVPDALNQYQR